ncbi:MAG: TRAP transporter small permease subunit [Rhodospirillaceae bacterium]|jgi:TRAP-type C4-dicarboxylate transport system permease small subunit|nr:TRAP transporter small permease subunit [Rhodospirillaceae bacterium]
MDSIVDKLYRGFRFLLDNIIGYSAIAIMLAGTGLAISEVARRYMFKTVFDWGQDAVTYGMVGAIFLYFAVTQARRSHLRMSALVDVLERRGWTRLVLVLRAFFTALGVVTYGAIAYWGVSTMERSMELGRKTYSMVIVIWPFQAILLAAFTLLALVCLFQLYQDIRALMGKKVFEWAPVEEGIEI